MNVWTERLQSWCRSEAAFYLLLESQLCYNVILFRLYELLSFINAQKSRKPNIVQVTHDPLQQSLMNTSFYLGLFSVVALIVPLTCDYVLFLRYQRLSMCV